MNKNVFVFVVCGAKEHTDALHYSLQALKKFSKTEILVLTDTSRNEEEINHDSVIDFITPIHFNHHQASIFLKTGIHKFLPTGNNYCYLDSDVVAVDEQVDSIFDQFVAPITFAPDHCVTNEFSPSAIHCNCAQEFSTWQKELKLLFAEHKNLTRVPRVPENLEKKNSLVQRLAEIKKSKWGYRWLSFKFNLSRNKFRLHSDAILDKQKECWFDKNGNPILYEKEDQFLFEETIESESNFKCDRNDFATWRMDGKNVFDVRCNHLQKEIKNEFGIEIKESEWQHWNGGVFLFNDSSHDFLNTWHEKTLVIFSLPNWKTRDQGTLIATAWQFNLQQHPKLRREFNLIADYQNLNIEHKGQLEFVLKSKAENIRPHFIHVYHHWADKRWDVWQAVEKITGIATDEDEQTINSLWIGKSLSQIELLTIHSFSNLGYRFRLWIYEPLETVLPNGVLVSDASLIIPRDKVFAYRNKNRYGHGKGSYAGFSDIFRYKLLFEKGGWWVDMDVTALQPLPFAERYFFRSHHDLKVVGNVMKCPKGSELMKLSYDEAMANVNEQNTDWLKPIAILNKHIAELHLEKFIQHNKSNEDKWNITSKFIWGEEELPTEWTFIHWQNEEWRKNAVTKTDFYFQSALAVLLAKYDLYQMPKTKFAQLINRLRHSSYFRVLENLFLADL